MLGWEGELPQPAVRTIEDMRSVLANPSCECSEPLYFMYRDLSRSETDWRWLRHHNLRYDITVIPSRNLCGEWVKTKGHYHPKNPAGVGYPEIYEVIEGHAHYLLQSRTLDDVVMIQHMPVILSSYRPNMVTSRSTRLPIPHLLWQT